MDAPLQMLFIKSAPPPPLIWVKNQCPPAVNYAPSLNLPFLTSFKAFRHLAITTSIFNVTWFVSGFTWDDDILWLKVSDSRVQSYLKWLKWYTMPSQMRAQIQSLEFDQTFIQTNLTKQLHIHHYGCMALTLLYFPAACALAQSRCGEWNGGKVQRIYLRYSFMNLIFIYFTKREWGRYWRGVLVRWNIVHEFMFFFYQPWSSTPPLQNLIGQSSPLLFNNILLFEW